MKKYRNICLSLLFCSSIHSLHCGKEQYLITVTINNTTLKTVCDFSEALKKQNELREKLRKQLNIKSDDSLEQCRVSMKRIKTILDKKKYLFSE